VRESHCTVVCCSRVLQKCVAVCCNDSKRGNTSDGGSLRCSVQWCVLWCVALFYSDRERRNTSERESLRCSVLQCVLQQCVAMCFAAVCCSSVLQQRVAVCCSDREKSDTSQRVCVLQCGLQYAAAVCCSRVLQCVAVTEREATRVRDFVCCNLDCSMLQQCVAAACCSVLQ